MEKEKSEAVESKSRRNKDKLCERRKWSFAGFWGMHCGRAGVDFDALKVNE
ncbi:MAG: hypothetical protein RR777_02270 [Christensenellaceae bacterium]